MQLPDQVHGLVYGFETSLCVFLLQEVCHYAGVVRDTDRLSDLVNDFWPQAEIAELDLGFILRAMVERVS